MSSNNSSSVDVNLVSVFTEPFLIWFKENVVPNIFGIAYIVYLILGIALNTAISIVWYKRRKADPVSPIQIQVLIIDVLALVLLILPSTAISFSKAETIPDVFCKLNGFLVLSLFTAQFVFLTIVLLHSTLTCALVNSDKISGKCFMAVVSILGWLISFAFPAAALATDNIQYLKIEFQCNLGYKNATPLFNAFISVSYFLTIIIALVCVFVVMMNLKRKHTVVRVKTTKKHVLNERVVSEQEHADGSQPDITGIQGNKHDDKVTMEYQSETGNDNISRHEDTCSKEPDTERNISEISRGSVDKLASETNVNKSSHVPEVKDDVSVEEKVETTSLPRLNLVSPRTEQKPTYSGTFNKVTNLDISRWLVHNGRQEKDNLRSSFNISFITWLFVFLCWAPYVTMVYIDMYGSLWWDGWITVTLSCGYFGYCIKPIIYLSFRKDIGKEARKVIPKKLRDNAKKLKVSVGKKLNTLDASVFTFGKRKRASKPNDNMKF